MKKDYLNILGIQVATKSREDFVDTINKALADSKPLFLTTPNPEIILGANRDEELHYILNEADLNIADGVGLQFAALLLGKKISRWPGSEICKHLLKTAERQNKKVAIVSWSGGLSTSAEIKQAISKKYPALKFIVEEIEREWSLGSYQAINVFEPDILLVGLGSPYQEKFIYKNLEKMKYLKIAIGVGGSFDYITGKVKPSPKILVKSGLEWLWRLLNIFSFSKPTARLKRIFNAVVVFPVKFLKWLLINPFLYRKNVACMLYKKIDDKYFIFILERIKEPGHWQLPQGGRDGERISDAATRELQEETGAYSLEVLKTFKNVHRYIFEHKNGREFRNYKGQAQSLALVQYKGKDSDIKINYWEYKDWKWVELDKLVELVHPIRREATEKFVEYFKDNCIM